MSKKSKEMSLLEHAEAWWQEQGNIIPDKNTIEHKEMYEKWVEFAFQDFKK